MPAADEFNRSVTLLQQGNWREGFALYETRWQHTGRSEPVFQRPRWDGSPLNGRRILLHAEQGLGDTLQFVRFARIARSRGGTVVLVAHPQLAPVLGGCKDIDEVFIAGGTMPRYHVHAPLMSLPHILDLQLDDLSSDAYLTANALRVTEWQQKLAAYPGVKVGICWQGGASNGYSAPLKRFAELAETPGVQFISLQKGLGTEQIAAQQTRMNIVSFRDRLDVDGAFVDTAAIMTNLDLVITVDTAIAHLAGALGVPVWIALDYAPDWRWMLGRSDSPWYSSARLFRQPSPGDWNSVFREMAAALAISG